MLTKGYIFILTSAILCIKLCVTITRCSDKLSLIFFLPYKFCLLWEVYKECILVKPHEKHILKDIFDYNHSSTKREWSPLFHVCSSLIDCVIIMLLSRVCLYVMGRNNILSLHYFFTCMSFIRTNQFLLS